MAQITDIKTPGVYVTEVPSFPPSIAQVATAVPAFTGYTEFAENLQPDDLLNIPTRITSLVEYQLYFGGAASPGINEVTIDAANAVTNIKRAATYYMYDSIRMFFLNGGNVCYITAVGYYGESIDKDKIKAGLDTLTKFDEPTLLLFPDAVLSNGLSDVQTHALQQCANLQDRFSILDLKEDGGWGAGKDDFRNNIGVQNLNYGAAYTPYIKTSLSLSVTYGDIKGKVFQAGIAIDFKNFTTSADAKNTIQSLNNLIADTTAIHTSLGAPLVVAPNHTVQEQWTALLNDYQSSFNNVGPADDESKFQKLLDFLYSTAHVVNDWATGLAGDFAGNGIKKDVKDLITNSLKDTVTKLLALDQGARDTIGGGAGYYDDRTAVLASFNDGIWGGIFGAPPAPNTAAFGPAPEPTQRQKALPSFITIFNQLNLGISQVLSLVATYENSFEQALLQSHPVYKQIITFLQNSSSTIPPSGAIAGIYTTVDSNRGVWKAPANISVMGVTGLTQAIDDLTQDDLNVDVMAGKSINAIRAFTGKGILVWGARTLDGNSNDFRYISVRRLYIMVEESVKKATQQFVFEPNDGNTWVRLRAMVENYLTNLWRQGALAGPKPEAAFYVKVGLGQTMTFDDILNGRMIVEIGMAPVRPAEFIILRFSQIQQQA